MSSNDFFNMDGLTEDIGKLLKTTDKLVAKANEYSLEAAMYATEIVEAEEKRLLGSKHSRFVALISRKVKQTGGMFGSAKTVLVSIGYDN